MKKINLLLVAIIVVLGGYTAASWWIGGVVERRLDRSERQVTGIDPNFAVISRDYRRGLFESTEDVTYGFSASATALLAQNRLLQAMPGLTPDSLRLTSHLKIHHGPLPQLRAVALASIDAQLQTPPALQRVADTVLHGAPILQAHTVIDFNGVSTAQIQSPSFSYQAADGTSVMWGGITGSGRTAGTLAALSGTLNMPGITFKGPHGGLELHDASVSANLRRALTTLYVGHTDFRLGTLSAQPDNGKSISISGVSLVGDSMLNGGYIDEHAVLGADKVDVAPFSFSRVGYSQSVNHLDGASVEDFITAMRNEQAQAGAAGAKAGDAARANLAIISRYGLQMALHQPVFQIERLGFVTPEGQLLISAKVAVPGLTPKDVQGPLGMLGLVQHLDMTADLRVDAALLDKILDASGKGEQLGPQLQQLEQAGYLRRDGSAFVTNLTFRSGALRINGQPFGRSAGPAAH